MKQEISAHPSESMLEAFLMERLPAQTSGRIYDQSLTELEEHLLVCQPCLEAAELHELLCLALETASGKRNQAAHCASFCAASAQPRF